MKTLSYIIGIFMVGSGIMCGIGGLIGAGSAIFENQLVTGIVVGGILLTMTLCFLVFGMKLVKHGESDAQSTSAPVPGDHDYDPTVHSANDLRTKFGSFDLSRLNIAGWLLFLATIVFIGSAITISVLVLDPQPEDQGIIKVAAIASFFLGIGFFFVGKTVLASIGIRLYNSR